MIYQFPRHRQPQTKSSVNWANPITRGLVWLPQITNKSKKIIDLANQIQGSVTGTITGVVSRTGKALNNGGTGNYVDFASVPHNITTGAWSVAVWYRHDGTAANYQTLVGINDNISVYMPYETVTEYLAVDSTTDSGGWHTGIPAVDDVWKFYVVTIPGSGSNLHGYVDGIDKGDFTDSAALSYSSLGTSSSIKLFEGQGSENARGDIVFAAVWNRELEPPEVKSLYLNCWQLFSPLQIDFAIDQQAVGGATGNLLLQQQANAC